MKKRGQLAIFIIVGVIIVAGVALFLLLKPEVISNIRGGKEINANSFLISCLEDKIREGIEKISLQGGDIEPVLYKGIWFDEGGPANISYLCYTKENYAPCVNQEPLLLKHLQEEIKEYIKEDVEKCFDSLKMNLQKRGYEVNGQLQDFEVKLVPNKIILYMNGELTATKEEDALRYEEFIIGMRTKLYNIAKLVQGIVRQEITSGDFDYAFYVVLNPEFYIRRFTTSDSSKIYIIKNKETKETFRFAIRGSVIPPGWGITIEE